MKLLLVIGMGAALLCAQEKLKPQAPKNGDAKAAEKLTVATEAERCSLAKFQLERALAEKDAQLAQITAELARLRFEAAQQASAKATSEHNDKLAKLCKAAGIDDVNACSIAADGTVSTKKTDAKP